MAIIKLPTTPHDFGQAVIDGITPGSGHEPHRSDRCIAAVARHDGRHQCAAGEQGRARRVRRDPRLARHPGTAPFVARRSLRSAAGRAGGACAAALALRDHRTDRRAGRGRDASAEEELPALIEAIRDAGLQTVAVSFLFSFLNDAHERRVGEALRAALPGVPCIFHPRCCQNPRIRTRQHDGGVCRCGAGAGLVSGPAAIANRGWVCRNCM